MITTDGEESRYPVANHQPLEVADKKAAAPEVVGIEDAEDM